MPGFLARGIGSRETYYFRRVFADAERAVEAARSLELVDSARVGVVGISQGGGIALAVSGLVPDLVAVVARVPFLCDFPRASVRAAIGETMRLRLALSVRTSFDSSPPHISGIRVIPFLYGHDGTTSTANRLCARGDCPTTAYVQACAFGGSS